MKSFRQFITESNPTFDQFVLDHIVTYSGTLYHATYMKNLYDILNDGLHGNSHGELREYETVSTSLNDGVFRLFSDTHSGLDFEVSDLKIFVIPDWFMKLYTDSGLEFDTTEEESMEMVNTYQIPLDSWSTIKHNYLSSVLKRNGIYAACYQYVADGLEHKRFHANDECEIIIFDPDKLMKDLAYIYIEHEEFDTPESALSFITDNYDLDEYEYKDEQ